MLQVKVVIYGEKYSNEVFLEYIGSEDLCWIFSLFKLGVRLIVNEFKNE